MSEQVEDASASTAARAPELTSTTTSTTTSSTSIVEYTPRTEDVISTRNSSVHRHPGNIAYTRLVDERRQEYQSAKSRGAKTEITLQVIQLVEESGGRFVKQVPTQQDNDHNDNNNSDGIETTPRKEVWVELTADEKREKVSHALRSQKKPRTTQKMIRKRQLDLEHSAALTLVQGFGSSSLPTNEEREHQSSEEEDAPPASESSTTSTTHPLAKKKRMLQRLEEEQEEEREQQQHQQPSINTDHANEEMEHPPPHGLYLTSAAATPGSVLFPPPAAGAVPPLHPAILGVAAAAPTTHALHPSAILPYGTATAFPYHPHDPHGILAAAGLPAAHHLVHQHPLPYLAATSLATSAAGGIPPNAVIVAAPHHPFLNPYHVVPTADGRLALLPHPGVDGSVAEMIQSLTQRDSVLAAEMSKEKLEKPHNTSDADKQDDGTVDNEKDETSRLHKKSQVVNPTDDHPRKSPVVDDGVDRKPLPCVKKQEAYDSILAMGQKYRDMDLLSDQQTHAKKMKSIKSFEEKKASEKVAPPRESPPNAKKQPIRRRSAKEEKALVSDEGKHRKDNNNKVDAGDPVLKRRWSSSLWKNHPGSTRRLPMRASPVAVTMERSVRRKPSWFHRIPTTIAQANSEEQTAGPHDYRDFLPPLPGVRSPSSVSKQNDSVKQAAGRNMEDEAPRVAEKIQEGSSPPKIPSAKGASGVVDRDPLVATEKTSNNDEVDAINKLAQVMDMPSTASASSSSFPPRRVSREEEPLLSTPEAQTSLPPLKKDPGMSPSSSCSSMSSLGSSASESDYALARAAHDALKKARSAAKS